MEGIYGWLLLAQFVYLGLTGLFLLPAFAAGVLLLARRPQLALMLFAPALLCVAVAWAVFFLSFLASGYSAQFILPVVLMGLSLLLAGSGQFVAALRSPRTYAVVLGFATGAVLVIMAGPILSAGLYNLTPKWLNGLVYLYWGRLPMVVTSLALAVASLMIAVFFPFGSRRRVPVHPSRLSGAGGRTTHCSEPGQVSEIRKSPIHG
jgi:hypothetical protein